MKNLLVKISPKGEPSIIEAGDHRSVRKAYLKAKPPVGGRLEIWNRTGGIQKSKTGVKKTKPAPKEPEAPVEEASEPVEAKD